MVTCPVILTTIATIISIFLRTLPDREEIFLKKEGVTQKMRGKERYGVCREEKMSGRVSMQHRSKVRLTYLLTSVTSDRVYTALQIINQ